MSKHFTVHVQNPRRLATFSRDTAEKAIKKAEEIIPEGEPNVLIEDQHGETYRPERFDVLRHRWPTAK